MHGFAWWRARGACAEHGGGCDEGVECGPGQRSWRGGFEGGPPFGGPPFGGPFGGDFGVRRPLRFIAHKLDLDEKQIAELAAILADIKTERAQAAVDDQRATSALADLLAGESFDEAKGNAIAGDRVKSAERVQQAVVRMLKRIHGLLDAEQRQRLAYVLRTGILRI